MFWVFLMYFLHNLFRISSPRTQCLNSEYPGQDSVVIFHKHKASHPYHQHGRANTLRQAGRGIKSHDR